MIRYDNHREQILRGSHTDYEDESLDVYQYFTVSCYKGFGDDPNGFYAIYEKVFDQLATEDIEFMDSPDEYENIPKFGKSTSDYDSVVGPFYAYWQSYCTKKTYTWLCPHNINEIRDRRILREIEKETKKIAQKARKERNEEIRALVSFVRKRDKRVQENKKKLEEKAEQNRIKQQQHRLAQLRKNQQEAEAMKMAHQSVFNTSDHEAQLREMEQAYGSDSDYDEDSEIDEVNGGDDEEEVDEDDEAEPYLDDLYCVACNKSFKNVSSYENHESSKKHRENIERLKKQMQDDEEEAAAAVENDVEVSDQIDEDTDVEPIAESVETKKKSNKKSKKSKNKAQVIQQPSDDELDQVAQPLTDINIHSDKDNWSDDAGKKNKKSKNKKSINKSKPKNNLQETDAVNESNDMRQKSGTSKKINKTVNKSTPIDDDDAIESIDTTHTCVTCQSTFDSKNKLFTHLKKTNHGVYIPKVMATDSKRGKRK